MTDCTTKILQHPTEIEIGEIAQVLRKAFEDDILGRSMVGGNAALAEQMWTAMVRAGALEGVLAVACESAQGRNVSAGIWFPPGRHFLATEAQLNLGWTDFMAALAPEFVRWWAKVDEESEKKWAELVGTDTYNDCWYAAFLGTDPAHRGRGYGSAMINTVLNEAAREKKMALLTTQSQDNAKWYQTLGFKQYDVVLDFSTSIGHLEAHFLSWTPPAKEAY